MGLLSTMVGMGFGFGLQTYSNAIRRLPLARGACSRVARGSAVAAAPSSVVVPP